jgi:hypothetical protein
MGKRGGSPALHDAGAIPNAPFPNRTARGSVRFWSAPPPRRFVHLTHSPRKTSSEFVEARICAKKISGFQGLLWLAGEAVLSGHLTDSDEERGDGVLVVLVRRYFLQSMVDFSCHLEIHVVFD